MLLEERELETGLSRNIAFGRLMYAGNQTKERRLAAAVTAKDSPAVSFGDSEAYSLEDSGRAEFYTGTRNRDLGQDRNTLEQAARQRSIVSRVWSPMCPMRNVALFILP